ncbi:MAG: glycosyltransferase family 2 protein [Bacteroidetes bacterium]|nr:glycosyltransferase family 2 protein [Bacteroidota bacterium]
MIKLSAVIITFNEEKNIERCLQSLAGIADEIVVIDSNSTDNTKIICEKFKARVINHLFEGHIEQKNFAITQAVFPHILSLDADESLDEILRSEILSVKNSFTVEGYTMNRMTNYAGQWIKHCGWYPDVKLRLWDSRKGQWGGLNPHDKFEMFNSKAPLKHLKGNILHYSYYHVAEHQSRAIRYAEIAAKGMYEKGVTISTPMIYVKTISKFIRNYILNLGFLDGKNGFLICKITAYETWFKYKMLRELKTKKPVTK